MVPLLSFDETLDELVPKVKHPLVMDEITCGDGALSVSALQVRVVMALTALRSECSQRGQNAKCFASSAIPHILNVGIPRRVGQQSEANRTGPGRRGLDHLVRLQQPDACGE